MLCLNDLNYAGKVANGQTVAEIDEETAGFVVPRQRGLDNPSDQSLSHLV